jgi:hypothetical protein
MRTEGVAAPAASGMQSWLAVEGQWIDPLGFAQLLSEVLWESYGRELKASWPDYALAEYERQRRTSRWLA